MIKSKNLLINLKHFAFRIYFRPNSHNLAFKEYVTDITESNLIKNFFNNLDSDGFYTYWYLRL